MLNMVLFFGIILVTFLTTWLVDRFFKRLIKKNTDFIQNDPTNYLFMRHAIKAVIITIGLSGAFYSVPSLRVLAGSLLTGAGILAVAVGFASQHALANVISGVFIVLFKPFRVNDRLTIKNMNGIVEDITLRHVIIRDFENKRIIIPNSNISNEVIVNADLNDSRICKWIDVGISYDSDIDLAKAIVAEEIKNHPLHLDARTPEQIEAGDPEVPVRVTGLGEYSVNLRAWAWAASSPDGFVMSCDVYESIKKRFDKEGIEIPFPYRTLVHKNMPPKG
ncbi:MAG: mechanosensitive ion channel family protein [Bacteroidetes bacterium]|nr:MAG: mechanosensitive ion channel family protein [Bacteroidota bacterium]